MKHALPLLLLFSMVACLFSAGCGAPPLNTDGLLAAAPDLIEASAKWNRLYYGEGLQTEEEGASLGVYREADGAQLDELGFHTVEEMQEKTREVFSSAYCKTLFSSAFSGFAEEGAGNVYARYSSSQAADARDENETILVSQTDYFALHPVAVTLYDYATLKIKTVTASSCTVTLSIVTTPYGGGTGEQGEMDVRFVYENGWRIDSPTY